MENKHLRNNLPLLRDSSTASGSQPCSPLIDPTTRHGFCPLRGRKSCATESSGKSLYSNDGALLRARWPSSSSYSSSKQSNNSLADYLSNDGLPGLVDRKSSTNSYAAGPQSLSRMRSCSEFSRFEEKKEEDEQKSSSSRNVSKENRPFGSSMRYIGKLRFPKSSSKTEINSRILPGRMSVDESILSNYRRTTDFAVDSLSSESDRSDSTKGMSPNIPRSRNKDSGPKSADRTPASKLAAAAGIRRSSSLTGKGPGLNLSPWALSPGHRSNSPPVRPPLAATMEGGGTPTRSFSSLRPENPDKSKKVGNIISMGMDLFRRKQGFTSSNIKLRPSSPVMVVGDVGHQFRMLRNCLIQWRYVNARLNFTNQTRTSTAEGMLMRAWTEIGKLQSSAMKKTLQLEREKLHLKLDLHLSWQEQSPVVMPSHNPSVTLREMLKSPAAPVLSSYSVNQM
ncbi:uncharacterized protein A4U43_C07F39580 [Asparagus officinalis]|uniref:Uncharacterized protein n=1 Tax=Asparagus officinalis TaxID=4686 RepID=A0A5P1ELL2_ASPOF|nr:uncharacterized protein A4U43_C07F39580 [Asparagus officinalis]